MSKRILVLSASVGAGHMRAAEAVELALRQTAPDAFVQNVDILTLTNAAFRRVYGKAYLDMVNHTPHLLGLMYDLLDKPRKENVGDRLLYLAQELNLKKVLTLIREGRWDVVVHTHFLPAEIFTHLREDGEAPMPHMVVTTDFETHKLWAHQPVERYTTATEEGAAYLATYGVSRGTISVTGIPIHPVFSEDKSREQCLKSQGLKGDRPILLQLAGGFGVGPIEKLFRGVLEIETPLEVAVVCGKNEALKKKLDKLKPPAKHRVKVIGFTKQMDELLTVADLVLTKPGGLTTSEVLAKGCAMAIVNPIPGQESRNSDFLLENGAAIKINNIATMPLKLSAVLGDRKRLELLKSNAKKLGKPRAAFEVAALALELATGR
jgi:processive 1,2-diacylglycerol beta-glucosyltransferase